ncbi:MAG: Lar family restriction alleviation protein [Gammaproteobacteria bacterium]|nr:Lar family restriction alleviation protein [Gammaproteobacteria bacterium]
MENIECPHCSEATITLRQKLKAGKWATIFCPSCNARMCANPIVMALMYFALTWNFLFFGYMAVRESSIAYGITMIVGWLILELFIYYIPLSRMRALKPGNNNPESDG